MSGRKNRLSVLLIERDPDPLKVKDLIRDQKYDEALNALELFEASGGYRSESSAAITVSKLKLYVKALRLITIETDRSYEIEQCGYGNLIGLAKRFERARLNKERRKIESLF